MRVCRCCSVVLAYTQQTPLQRRSQKKPEEASKGSNGLSPSGTINSALSRFFAVAAAWPDPTKTGYHALPMVSRWKMSFYSRGHCNIIMCHIKKRYGTSPKKRQRAYLLFVCKTGIELVQINLIPIGCIRMSYAIPYHTMHYHAQHAIDIHQL